MRLRNAVLPVPKEMMGRPPLQGCLIHPCMPDFLGRGHPVSSLGIPFPDKNCRTQFLSEIRIKYARTAGFSREEIMPVRAPAFMEKLHRKG
jgi:hypothetical protein